MKSGGSRAYAARTRERDSMPPAIILAAEALLLPIFLLFLRDLLSQCLWLYIILIFPMLLILKPLTSAEHSSNKA